MKYSNIGYIAPYDMNDELERMWKHLWFVLRYQTRGAINNKSKLQSTQLTPFGYF
jgi:hypothetical protein